MKGEKRLVTNRDDESQWKIYSQIHEMFLTNDQLFCVTKQNISIFIMVTSNQ